MSKSSQCLKSLRSLSVCLRENAALVLCLACVGVSARGPGTHGDVFNRDTGPHTHLDLNHNHSHSHNDTHHRPHTHTAEREKRRRKRIDKRRQERRASHPAHGVRAKASRGMHVQLTESIFEKPEGLNCAGLGNAAPAGCSRICPTRRAHACEWCPSTQHSTCTCPRATGAGAGSTVDRGLPAAVQ